MKFFGIFTKTVPFEYSSRSAIKDHPSAMEDLAVRIWKSIRSAMEDLDVRLRKLSRSADEIQPFGSGTNFRPVREMIARSSIFVCTRLFK